MPDDARARQRTEARLGLLLTLLLAAVPLSRPAHDYRTCEVEITELCAPRALTEEEHDQAEHRLRAFLHAYLRAP